MWMVMVALGAGCGGGDDAPLDPYTMPSVAGCRLDEEMTDVGDEELLYLYAVDHDEAGNEILVDYSEDGVRYSHLEASWDEHECRTRYVEQTVDDGVVTYGYEASGDCWDDGAHGRAEGEYVVGGEALPFSVDSATIFDGGLPVLQTLLYTQDDSERVERTAIDWVDGEPVERRRYLNQTLDLYEIWARDDAGRVTTYEYGDDDSVWYRLFEYDEHGRVIRDTSTRDLELENVEWIATYAWSDTQYTPVSATMDDYGDGVVNHEITYDCTEGWPWSCVQHWAPPGSDDQYVLEQTWSCGGEG